MSVIEGVSFASMPDTYEHDEDFKEVWLHVHEHPTHTLVDYTLRDNFLYFKRKLCVTKPFRSALIKELHKPPYVGHRGIAATFQNVCRDFFWPHMKQDVKNFVSTCLVCQKVKSYTGKKIGLLHPLPIPDRPWEHISMDFITGFPLTAHKCDMIWTVVDHFSKQVYFVPCNKTLTAFQAAHLFLKHVFPHHGLPKVIVSDRDSKFCSAFWTTLFDNLGITLDFTYAFHPESNGQSGH